MATPLRCVAVQLWRCQTTIHIPLLVSAVVCLCCGCFCVLVELSRVTCRVHRMWASIISWLDNVPTPTPCLRPRQQCQLQPVPSISYINIIFFCGFSLTFAPSSGALRLKIYQIQQGLRRRLIKVNLFYVDNGVLKSLPAASTQLIIWDVLERGYACQAMYMHAWLPRHPCCMNSIQQTMDRLCQRKLQEHCDNAERVMVLSCGFCTC